MNKGKKVKRLVVLVLVISLIGSVVLLGGCGKKETEADILKISIDGEPLHLDESLTMDYLTIWAATPVNDYLVVFDKEMNVVNSLAEEMEQVDDVTFRFKIVEGVKFHNGREVKAEDVKYSIERVSTPDAGSELSVYFGSVDHVEVTGDYEVLVHLSEPYAPFLGKLTRVPIVPEEAADTLKTNPVGCGPFKFVEWKKDQSIDYVKNEDYWREGYPKMDGISFKIIKEYNSIRSAFLAGELDILQWVTNVDVPSLEETEGVYMYNNELQDAFFLMCNNEVEPLNDPKVRKAIALALDKYELIEMGHQGFGVKLDTAVYPTSQYYDASLEYDQDIEEAKKLLAEAGYPDGFSIKLSVPITPVEGVLGEIVQNQLKEIGIEAQVEKIEVSVFLDTVFGRKDYEVMVAGDAGDGDPDTWLARFCKSGAPNNFGNYSNPELDQLIDAGIATYDEAERKGIYLDAFTIMEEEHPITFLFGGVLISALHDDIQGFEGLPTWRYDLSGVYRVTEE